MRRDTAIKMAVVIGSAAIGLAAVGIISYANRPTICVPPAVPEKCPPNPALPPAGYRIWSGTVPSEISALAQAALANPMGTWVPGPPGTGVLLEWHYHPPCGALKPWGCHKGATAYRNFQ